ncbi:MAG TPA: tRNA (adenosine(37)-N6)-threonylcarbamoyltransferase complex ATPase subunit type 1 TsaE [Phycisphaerae bacterium]|nr:tRNA (adenosine(37)-N6)-threonylcarbamoyltransferase complex ATPase subunit type 1 TsaE [Phycisphaerae bacterium]HNU46918.1 tRNA (adenosine(37)-N6)-threonylcarbamoyltransferase complex ATPase subunit type 1 TsaE [Phycisphaerae bacterium]
MPFASAKWDTNTPDGTRTLGAILGACLPGGMVVALVGGLGSGKTVLVQGLAAGNAVGPAVEVTSPTFTLVHEYPGRLTLYHLDAYRLKDAADFARLGFDELLREDSAAVVEWADRVRPALPEDALWITLEVLGPTARRLTLRAAGPRSEQCLKALQEATGS